MRKVILAIIASASAMTAQVAAAQGPVAAAPPQAAPTTIVYSNKGPNGMSDLPMGAHHVPDSNVIISGHQKGGGIGALFGVVGMLVQSSANASAGNSAVRNVQDDLRFDVTTRAAELTPAILADDKYRQLFALSPQPGGGTLTVVPYVVITFVNETEVRPYVVLKTKLTTGAPSESPRTIKYFCCEGRPLPLSGENGLSENGGERLKALLTSELETAIRVMLLDRSQPFVRNDQAKLTVQGSLPFIGKSVKSKGYDLGHYNDYALIEFRGGGSVIGGVHVAEPASLEITPR